MIKDYQDLRAGLQTVIVTNYQKLYKITQKNILTKRFRGTMQNKLIKQKQEKTKQLKYNTEAL